MSASSTTTPANTTTPTVARIAGAFIVLFGTFWLIVSLIGWYNEFAGDTPEPLFKATIASIDARPPYDNSRRTSVVMRYPVFEYRDAHNVKLTLAGKAALLGYFELGQEVSLGRIRNANDRLVVLDSWFRSQQFLYAIIQASLLTVVGALVLFHRAPVKPVEG